jgi:hypothetical protein
MFAPIAHAYAILARDLAPNRAARRAEALQDSWETRRKLRRRRRSSTTTEERSRTAAQAAHEATLAARRLR